MKALKSFLTELFLEVYKLLPSWDLMAVTCFIAIGLALINYLIKKA